MSELKGQLLGMILVFSIFAVAAGILVGAFKANATNIASSMDDEGLVSATSYIRTLLAFRG